MKLIFLAIICILFSYIGFKISLFYRKKVKLLRELVDFVNYLILNISFLKTDLFVLLNNYNAKDKDFKEILILYKDYVENGLDLKFKDALFKSFNKDIASCILSFFQSLGKLDYTNQLKMLELNKKHFDEIKLKSEMENKTKGNLYYKLGLIIGIGMMILLV